MSAIRFGILFGKGELERFIKTMIVVCEAAQHGQEIPWELPYLRGTNNVIPRVVEKIT